MSFSSRNSLKELDDKSPLSAAIPGCYGQLKRLIEPAAIDIAAWLEPEIKSVDPAPVARMWSGLNLDPLPEDLIGNSSRRTTAGRSASIKRDADLRQQLGLALQEDERSFNQRFAPGFDLIAYREYLRKKCGNAPALRHAFKRV